MGNYPGPTRSAKLSDRPSFAYSGVRLRADWEGATVSLLLGELADLIQ